MKGEVSVMMRRTWGGLVLTLEEFSRSKRTAVLEIRGPSGITTAVLDEADLRELMRTTQVMLQDWDTGPLGGWREDEEE